MSIVESWVWNYDCEEFGLGGGVDGLRLDV